MLAELVRRESAVRRPDRCRRHDREWYSRLQEPHRNLGRIRPLEVASIDGFRRDPARVWEFYGLRLQVLAGAKPERRPPRACGARGARARAGGRHTERRPAAPCAGSRDVIEVHGSIATASCPACGRREQPEQIRELLPLPRCADCGTVLKPDVVMFGEICPRPRSIAPPPLRRRRRSCSWSARRSRYGRSRASGRDPAQRRPLAIVNREPTSYDRAGGTACCTQLRQGRSRSASRACRA